MELFHQTDGVADAVKEIRIAEGDMLGTAGYLLANVPDDHAAWNDEKPSAIDGNDRAVTAQVLTATAGLCVAHRAAPVLAHLHIGIARQRRQAIAPGHAEVLLDKGNDGFRLRLQSDGAVGRQPFVQADQAALEFTAEDRPATQFRPQERLVQRRIKAIEAEMSRRIEGPDPRYDNAG